MRVGPHRGRSIGWADWGQVLFQWQDPIFLRDWLWLIENPPPPARGGHVYGIAFSLCGGPSPRTKCGKCSSTQQLMCVSDELVAWRGWSLRTFSSHAFDGPKALKKQIARACRAAGANACSAWAATKAQRALGDDWYCSECGKQCKNSQSLAAHRFSKHGIKRVTRQHVAGTHCIACLMQFHERERLIQHLERGSKRCRAVVIARSPALPLEEVQRLDDEATAHARLLANSGRCRVHAILPCIRLHGPLLPSDPPRRSS